MQIDANTIPGFRFSSDSEIDETKSKEVLDQSHSGDVGSMALIDKRAYVEGITINFPLHVPVLAGSCLTRLSTLLYLSRPE